VELILKQSWTKYQKSPRFLSVLLQIWHNIMMREWASPQLLNFSRKTYVSGPQQVPWGRIRPSTPKSLPTPVLENKYVEIGPSLPFPTANQPHHSTEYITSSNEHWQRIQTATYSHYSTQCANALTSRYYILYLATFQPKVACNRITLLNSRQLWLFQFAAQIRLRTQPAAAHVNTNINRQLNYLLTYLHKLSALSNFVTTK